jgi:ribosomal protein S18 acetylase RimI-like enzyme
MIEIVSLQATDADWLAGRWDEAWGGQTMVSQGRLHRLADQAAFIARIDGEPVGYLTFWNEDGEIEITSLESLVEGKGVGSALLAAVAADAVSAGASRIWLVTTNDNLRALGFYQKRGFRLAGLFPGAVDDARAVKPSIPLIGEHGIPLHDEIMLERRFEIP